MIYFNYKFIICCIFQRADIPGVQRSRNTQRLHREASYGKFNFEAEAWQEACAASCLIAAGWTLLLSIIGVLVVALMLWLSSLGFIPTGVQVQTIDGATNGSIWNESYILDWSIRKTDTVGRTCSLLNVDLYNEYVRPFRLCLILSSTRPAP